LKTYQRLLGLGTVGLGVTLCAGAQVYPQASVGKQTLATLDLITTANLRGDLSFIASDTLQGRFTPSPGLDVAAEFIASQFRAAGLEPAGDQDYFQVAHMIDRKMPKTRSPMTFTGRTGSMAVPQESWQVYRAADAKRIDNVPIAVFPSPDPEALKGINVAGKAVVAEYPDLEKLPREQAMARYRKIRAFNKAVENSMAAVEILLSRSTLPPPPPARLFSRDEAQTHSVPMVILKGTTAIRLSDLRTVTVELPAPTDQEVIVKNVIGILRGSDARLKDTYVMLTAHYDHIGTRETGAGMASPSKPTQAADRIYNGANDDGSGTVSVMEIARALAQIKPHPKRTLVFMTFFGEELGEIGSKYYGQHPVFPIANTVADINLEQVGRTDSTEGKQINTASLTGYDYSDVTKYLERAGKETGIKVYKDAQGSDAYFTRSDNDALAEQGVPAHSLTVAFDYPDYHGLSDEWQKIDYENMARVDRMVALGLLEMADDRNAPHWNAQNAKTAPFRQAQEKLRQP
jgi:Peptidase family M28